MHLDFLVMAIEAAFIHVMSNSPAEIRFIANLWTLVEHPSASGEWTLSEKVSAVRDAGFDGINDRGSEELRVLLDEHGLEFSGLFCGL